MISIEHSFTLFFVFLIFLHVNIRHKIDAILIATLYTLNFTRFCHAAMQMCTQLVSKRFGRDFEE